MPTSRAQPVLIGGLVMGVLSALPLVSAANLCCCLWVTSGGLVAAYLLQQGETAPITYGDGALVGLQAGLAGAVVYLILSIPITLLLLPFEHEMLARVFARLDRMPPELREFASSRIGVAIGIAVGFMVMTAAGSIFSTMGGLLGVVLFGKPTPPGPTPDSDPPHASDLGSQG